MSVPVKYGGAWEDSDPYVRYGDAWHRADVYVKYGDVWTLVHAAATADLVGGSVSHTAISPQTASAGYKITSTGSEQTDRGGTLLTRNQKVVDPASELSNYEARLTVNSGFSPTGPALGTWHSLGVTLAWYVTVGSIGGSRSTEATIQIRRKGESAILDSAPVSLLAYVSNDGSGGGVNPEI
ncbi:MAG: hypothetical protein MK104_03310 [Erythrobacter sp.]|nr:hypothetical protein [Erythrobacter sp.]